MTDVIPSDSASLERFREIAPTATRPGARDPWRRLTGVTGASGRLGRLVVEELLERMPADRLAVISSAPHRLRVLRATGADVRFGTFNEPTSLREALTGIERLVLVSTPSTGRRDVQHGAALLAARQAGVRRIVFASMLWEHDGEPSLSPAAGEFQRAEEQLVASGLSWAVARCAPFVESHVVEQLTIKGNWRREFLASGRIVSNAGHGRAAFVSRRDCAAVLASLLLDDGHGGRAYDVTGPEALSWYDVAAIVAGATGHHVLVDARSDEDFWDLALAAGLSDRQARELIGFGVAMSQGSFAGCGDAVERLTGRSATSVADVVARNRSRFISVVRERRGWD
jgi:NAD(P)H dehydrogenase (quinone)